VPALPLPLPVSDRIRLCLPLPLPLAVGLGVARTPGAACSAQAQDARSPSPALPRHTPDPPLPAPSQPLAFGGEPHPAGPHLARVQGASAHGACGARGGSLRCTQGQRGGLRAEAWSGSSTTPLGVPLAYPGRPLPAAPACWCAPGEPRDRRRGLAWGAWVS